MRNMMGSFVNSSNWRTRIPNWSRTPVRLGILALLCDGSPRWAIRLEVVEGEYAGRTAAWDGLVWSERGLPRVKNVLKRLGFDVTGPLNVDPEDLVGCRITAEYITEEREDPESGRRIVRLRVPYMGYQETPTDEAPF